MLKYETLSVGALQCNCHIVYDVDTKSAVIVDPGAEPERIFFAVERLGVAVRCIILTHGHFDHIGAVDDAAQKYGCDVVISEKDAPMLYDARLNLSAGFGDKLVCRVGGLKTVADEMLGLIGGSFRFMITPGHTEGSMCIEAGDLLLTGDTLFYGSVGRAFPPYFDTETEVSSIKNKLLTLDGDRVCLTGHGPNTTLERERSCNPFLI